MFPNNENALRAADAIELSIDLLSNRVPVGRAPLVNSGWDRSVKYSENLNYGRIGTHPANWQINTMQGIQTIQYGYDATQQAIEESLGTP